METLLYLLTLFFFLFAGMGLVKSNIIPMKSVRLIDTSLAVCLYALLFFMGVRTGLIEDFWSQVGSIGGLAASGALLASAGSIAAVVSATIIARRANTRWEKAKTEVTVKSLDGQKVTTAQYGSQYSYKQDSEISENYAGKSFFLHFIEPLKLISLVVSGVIASSFTPLFNWFNDEIANWLLYVLLFLVGAQMIQGSRNMLGILKNPISIVLPFITIIGSFLGGSLLVLFFPLELGESLAVVSGLGWYSLSGVLITNLGDPILGSVAFLSNLFRESIAFITIPLLASYNQKHAAISVAGATSMDITLPILDRSCGADYAALALAHGIVLTILVPFLVPIVYSIP